jgi:hypothetical protein
MNSAVEFHDSDCLEIISDSDGNSVVILDAYVHRSEGEPGSTPGDGGMQRIHITMGTATRSGEIGTLPATIYKGSLIVGSSSLGLVPLPFRSSETCDLNLEFLDDASMVRITGNSISIKWEGEFRFVEKVDSSDQE